ncbi:MAG: hypothetical protein ABWZ85_10540 [Luteibacter sp.]
MKIRYLLAATSAAATLLFVATDATAVACAAGVYRAGCVGPNGAVAVRKPVQPQVVCAKGVYRAGCAGPNGAVVRRRY